MSVSITSWAAVTTRLRSKYMNVIPSAMSRVVEPNIQHLRSGREICPTVRDRYRVGQELRLLTAETVLLQSRTTRPRRAGGRRSDVPSEHDRNQRRAP